jgi:catechol 2,3-dioxygenase-like lactoylglutathione lyase family enzyme
VFDHVTLRVPDLAAAEERFQTLLDPLAFDESLRTRNLAMWDDFNVSATDREHNVTRRAQIMFAASTDSAAADFADAARTAGLTEDEDGAFADERGNRFSVLVRTPRHPGTVARVTLQVADLAASTRFYTAIGIDLERTMLRLAEGEPTAGLHLAFPGDDAAVRHFFSAGVAGGGRANGGPGERAVYHPGYYAAYVLDPDGNNIEVVNHHRG